MVVRNFGQMKNCRLCLCWTAERVKTTQLGANHTLGQDLLFSNGAGRHCLCAGQ